MTMKVIPVAGALGAVIEGVDPRDDDFDVAPVRAALLEHEVVFFRGLHLSFDEHLEFGRLFGTPSVYPVARILGATEPTMTTIEDGPDSPNAADAWHTDVTWTAEPPAFALLHSEVVPERGGDTLWASATKAYEAFSPAMQEFLCGLTVVHDHSRFNDNVRAKGGEAAEGIIEALDREYPPVEHPMIRTHPETGKRALLFARRFVSHVKDLTEAESDAIIRMVDDHVKEASLQCRWQWSPGDLAIWDERSTFHRAAADHWPHRRVIRRLEIDGDRPFFDPSR